MIAHRTDTNQRGKTHTHTCNERYTKQIHFKCDGLFLFDALCVMSTTEKQQMKGGKGAFNFKFSFHHIIISFDVCVHLFSS